MVNRPEENGMRIKIIFTPILRISAFSKSIILKLVESTLIKLFAIRKENEINPAEKSNNKPLFFSGDP